MQVGGDAVGDLPDLGGVGVDVVLGHDDDARVDELVVLDRRPAVEHELEEHAGDVAVAGRVLGDRGVDGPVADGLEDGRAGVDADEADALVLGVLVPFRQDGGGGDGRVVARGDDPVDLVHPGRQGALDLDRRPR